MTAMPGRSTINVQSNLAHCKFYNLLLAPALCSLLAALYLCTALNAVCSSINDL